MDRYLLALLFSLSCALTQYVIAAETADGTRLEALPDAPPPPERVHSGEALEPDVTIIQKDDSSMEEYRVNNRLYMVKIVPVIGKPYYLLDNNGDGTLETEMNDLIRNTEIPHWVLFSW
jgi:hypothetical protein